MYEFFGHISKAWLLAVVQRLSVADWLREQLRFICVRSRDVDYTGGQSHEKTLNSERIVESTQSPQYTVSLLVVDCGYFVAYLVSARAKISVRVLFV